MFKHMGALLAATAASTAGRIFGAENIERHIDSYGGRAGWTQRSRGAATKPKRKRNMLHVSRRVRRKHRRAA
jgi:hypothetical protein